MSLNKKEQRLRRSRQTRNRIALQRVARLTVFRSNLHIYASVISEDGSKVLATASTAEKEVRAQLGETGKGGQIIWPDLGALRFGVRKASIKLGPVAAGFDLDKGEVGLGVSKHGDIKMGAQVPLGQGVGLEVGGIGTDDVGARAGTIGYEILTGLGRRYFRRYVGG